MGKPSTAIFPLITLTSSKIGHLQIIATALLQRVIDDARDEGKSRCECFDSNIHAYLHININ